MAHHRVDDMKVIPATKILNLIKRGDPVRCRRKIIKGDLDIGKLHLQEEDDKFLVTSIIEIVDSKICGDVSFSDVIFNNGFDKSVDFTKTNFNGRVNFDKASFCNGADFIESEFNKKVNFENAVFYNAVFSGAKFRGYADFRKSKFYDSIILDGIQFYNYANFVEAKFNHISSFHWVSFYDYANFSKAEFVKKANFNRVRFKDDADCRGALFGSSFSLMESNFERFRVEWDNIKDHLIYDPAIYLLLINNFKNMGSYRDADNCYYQYRKQVQKNKKWHSSSSKFIKLGAWIWNEMASYLRIVYNDIQWLHLRYLSRIYQFNWSKLYDLISEISCGYGVRILPIILWMIGLSLIFGFSYYIFTGIGEIVSNEASKTVISSENVSILDSIYFSIMAMTGKPPISYSPIGNWKYIVIIESVLGYLFQALFVFVIIRKLIR